MSKMRDPIHGDIHIPEWLEPLLLSYPLNRLRFIKQLGMKSYAGPFPGANHTRFSHCLGTMHLASFLCDSLYKNTKIKDLKGSVQEYKNTVQVAALVHDIGHGPFSHVMDEVLKEYMRRSHEDMTASIVQNVLGDDIRALRPPEGNVEPKDVSLIALGSHPEHSYLNDIVHSEIDVDRMDYLPRDSYHAGIEYRFGPASLINNMKIIRVPAISPAEIGELREIIRNAKTRKEFKDFLARAENVYEDHTCVSGEEGVVLCELLLIIRRTMYKSVYYESKSRVAEKMVYKAILSMLEDKLLQKKDLTDPHRFIELDDIELFGRMQEAKGFPARIVNFLKRGITYKSIELGTIEEFDTLKEAVVRKRYGDIRRMEKELAGRWNASPQEVIIDLIQIKAFEEEKVFVEIEPEKLTFLEKISKVAQSLISPFELEGKVFIYVDTDKIKTEEGRILEDAQTILGGGKNVPK